MLAGKTVPPPVLIYPVFAFAPLAPKFAPAITPIVEFQVNAA